MFLWCGGETSWSSVHKLITGLTLKIHYLNFSTSGNQKPPSSGGLKMLVAGEGFGFTSRLAVACLGLATASRHSLLTVHCSGGRIPTRQKQFCRSPWQPREQKSPTLYRVRLFWLRGRDSNPRTLGYEPSEMPLLHPASQPPAIEYLSQGMLAYGS